jgi:hypothetical protein
MLKGIFIPWSHAISHWKCTDIFIFKKKTQFIVEIWPIIYHILVIVIQVSYWIIFTKKNHHFILQWTYMYYIYNKYFYGNRWFHLDRRHVLFFHNFYYTHPCLVIILTWVFANFFQDQQISDSMGVDCKESSDSAGLNTYCYVRVGITSKWSPGMGGYNKSYGKITHAVCPNEITDYQANQNFSKMEKVNTCCVWKINYRPRHRLGRYFFPSCNNLPWQTGVLVDFIVGGS